MFSVLVSRAPRRAELYDAETRAWRRPVRRIVSLKQALKLAPMDECIYSRLSKQRHWWRYGWASGYSQLRLDDCLAPVTSKLFRQALSNGYIAGQKARCEHDAAQGAM